MKSKGTVGTSLTKVKEAILFRRFLGASVVGMVIFVMAFVLAPYISAEANAASLLASADVDWSAATLTLDPDYGETGSGDVDFGSIVPTSKVSGTSYGSLRVVKKTIGVTTSGSHFAVYLSTNGDTTGLNLVVSGSGDGAVTNSNVNIPALTNTIASPTTFVIRDNKGWGYNVPNAGTDGNVTGASDFNGSTALVTDTTITSSSTGSAATTYTGSLWAGVTNVNNPAMIWSATTSNIYGFGGENGDTNNNFDIYYGVAVDTDVLAGTYQNKVLYTAIASTDAIDTVSSNILRSGDEFVAGGNTLTVEFDLTHSVPTQTLAEDDFTITLIPHGALYDAELEYDEGTDTYTGGFDYDKTATELAALSGVSCPVATNSLSMATGDSTTRSSIACTLPANDAEDGSGNASYDIWMHIDRYNIDYLSHYTYEYDDGDAQTEDVYDVATITYAGLQSYFPNTGSTYGSAATYTDPRFTENTTLHGAGKVAYYMQDMTSSICKMTNKWSNALGLNARVYNYAGTGDPLANTMNGSMEIGVGTFALRDERDNKDYLVRRLADGNCWMVQNLDLDLAQYNSSNKLSADLTDIDEDWDPYASTYAKYNATNGLYKDYLAAASLTNDFQGMMNWLNGNATQTQQYQNSTQYSGNWYWGVKRTANDNIGSSVVNNGFSEIPRSYDNTVNGTSNVRYVAMDVSTGKTYKTVDASDTTSASWVEGMTGNNATVATTTNGLTSTSKLNTPGADATTKDDDVWNFYGSMYIGKYYNWYAATAGTGTYNMATDGNANSQASGSICPSGWGLPYDYNYTAGRGNSWYNLLITSYNLTVQTSDGDADTANSMKVRQAPLSLPLSGYYYWSYGSLNNRGYSGNFWSRSASTNTGARFLYFNTVGRVNPQGSGDKVYGFTVRCVAH